MKLKSQHVNVIKMLAYTSIAKRNIAKVSNISEQTLYNWLKDESFKQRFDLYTNRYNKAVEEYQKSMNYEKFLDDLEITKDDINIINALAYVDTHAPGVDIQKGRVDKLLDRCIDLVEKRISTEMADDDLVIYLLDKYFKKLQI